MQASPDQAPGKRLRVAQLVPAMDSGGVERGTLEVARALVKEGHDAIVLSAGGKMVSDLEAIGATHMTCPIGRKSLASLRWVRALRKWMVDANVDIVHARSRVPAWLCYLAWRRMNPTTRPRFVTTVHGLYSINRYSAIMTRGERVVAVSNAVYDYIIDNYRVDPERIDIIPRGVDRSEFPYGYEPTPTWQAAWNTSYPLLRERFVITLPGRLTRLKGHFDFLEIIGRLHAQGIPVQGLVVGAERKAGDAYAASVYAKASEQDLPVIFTGVRSDMREIYSVSDVVVSLSTSPESFGRTVLEALSVSTPVVGYAHGGVSEILATVFPAGAVAPGDIDGATERLAAFYKDRPVPSADHPFTLAAMLDKTLALYQTVRTQQP